jgi:Protein of unknown function, DUF488
MNTLPTCQAPGGPDRAGGSLPPARVPGGSRRSGGRLRLNSPSSTGSPSSSALGGPECVAKISGQAFGKCWFTTHHAAGRSAFDPNFEAALGFVAARLRKVSTADRHQGLNAAVFGRRERNRMSAGLVSIGYEGRNLEELLVELTVRGVDTVADVRLTPISRKRGLSKTRLKEALKSQGIEYLHLRALGNPKDNRASFAGNDLAVGRARFRGLLEADESRRALGELAARARGEVVAVLCFEANPDRCHRSVILEELPGADCLRVVQA